MNDKTQERAFEEEAFSQEMNNRIKQRINEELQRRADEQQRQAGQEQAGKRTRLFKRYTVQTAIQEHKSRPDGISTPFELEDVEIPRGAITLLAGSTSHGKTTALVTLCHHIHKETGGKILYYSVEEQPSDIGSRIVASKSMLTYGDNTDGNYPTGLSDGTYEIDPNIIATLEVGKIIRNDNPAELNKINCLNIDYIDIIDCSCFYERKAEEEEKQQIEDANNEEKRTQGEYRTPISQEPYEHITEDIAEQLKEDKENNIQAVIIDYLQIIVSRDGAQARDQAITNAITCIASPIRTIRKDVAMILGAQLNREHEKEIKQSNAGIKKVREKTKPRSWHLRDGGSEQFASLILSVNYPHKFSKKIPNNIIDIHTVKNRYGGMPTSTCTLYPAHSLICSNKPIEPTEPTEEEQTQRDNDNAGKGNNQW